MAASAALTLGLACGGCSLSYQMESLFGGSDKSDQTGSITPPPGSKQVSELPPDADLAFARDVLCFSLDAARDAIFCLRRDGANVD